MTNETFQNRLDDLAQQIETLPESERARLLAMVAETGDRRERAHAATAELGDAIGSLRLTAQYLAFDLEATRREKVLLQAALDRETD